MYFIQVLHLGQVDYTTALQLQKTLADLRKQNRIGDVMLLLEHPPVITMGRNAVEQNIVASREFLAERGVEIHETDRGGDVTFHGPGQLVGYPICDLRALPPKINDETGEEKRIGPVEFVRRMEEVLIRTCAEFGIATERIAGRTGVWTQPNNTQPEAKIAAIGVHVSRGVTSHGFAFNITTELEDFRLIVPCGISDKPVTRLVDHIESERMPSMEQIMNAVTRKWGNVFGVQILWLESLEALMSAQQEPNLPINDALREPEELKRMREELQGSSIDKDVNFSV